MSSTGTYGNQVGMFQEQGLLTATIPESLCSHDGNEYQLGETELPRRLTRDGRHYGHQNPRTELRGS